MVNPPAFFAVQLDEIPNLVTMIKLLIAHWTSKAGINEKAGIIIRKLKQSYLDRLNV